MLSPRFGYFLEYLSDLFMVLCIISQTRGTEPSSQPFAIMAAGKKEGFE
jgi:hypothetical protein